MKKMLIKDISEMINAQLINFKENFYIKNVSTDTRTLQKGDIYFAIKGKNFNGHDFIEIAKKKGACAIVCEKDLNFKDIPILKVKDTIKAFQDLAYNYRKTIKTTIITVTGSNGKTTTKNMIANVLSLKYKVFQTDKNYNNEIGLPKSILEIDDTYDMAVLEIGMNHLGEIKLLSKIASPDIAVITNIGKYHIGNLGSKENILKAKLEILEGLKLNGMLILNSDDNLLKNLKIKKFNTHFVGINEKNLSAYDIKYENLNTYFKIKIKNIETSVNLPLYGTHNISNSLFSIYLGIYFNISIEKIVKELENYNPAPMRCEVSYIKGITIIKDYYNSSPDSAKLGLEMLSFCKDTGKKIAILGEISELGKFSEQEHLNLGVWCCKNQIDYSFFIGENFQNFKNGMKKNSECFINTDRLQFIKSIKKFIGKGNLKTGDTILIKGSRTLKMEEIYEILKLCLESTQKNDNLNFSSSGTKLYIDINAIKFNYLQIQRFIGNDVEIMPMVKANAYGAGSSIISNLFKNCKYLAVGDIIEANIIKSNLPKSKIVIIYQPNYNDIEEIVTKGYIPSISDINFAEKLNKVSYEKNKITTVHIELDTGHCRLGINLSDVEKFSKKIKTLKNLKVDGIFMHYVVADSTEKSDLEFTKIQTDKFISGIKIFEKQYGSTVKYKHACAGSAIFNEKACHFNMVRPGYILYGYYPDEYLKSKIKLKPSLKFSSTIIQIRTVLEDTPISYNRKYYTKRKSKIATVSIGYSDGIFRNISCGKKSAYFVVNGQKAPIVGRICMDLTMIDITDITGNVTLGDEVFIFDNINVTVEEIADISNTIGYEIISKISDKSERIEIF